MKNIDVKSLIIGALLTSTIFLGVAATSPTDKWDVNQEWRSVGGGSVQEGPKGYEPFGVAKDGNLFYRKRTK